MVVRLVKHHLDYFRRKALANENEVFAYLIGRRVSPHLVEVHHFKYPKIESCSPSHVLPDNDSAEVIYEWAKEQGLQVVGSIHSHPGKDAAIFMSKHDKKDHIEQGDHITGIVEVNGDKTYAAFWVPNDALPCTKKYF